MCTDLKKVCSRVGQDQRVKERWSWNGEIYCKIKGTVYNVTYDKPIDDLLNNTEAPDQEIQEEDEQEQLVQELMCESV